MELVAMPLSQRTRSSPVTRSQAVSSKGIRAAEVRQRRDGIDIGWSFGGLGDCGGAHRRKHANICVHLDYSGAGRIHLDLASWRKGLGRVAGVVVCRVRGDELGSCSDGYAAGSAGAAG